MSIIQVIRLRKAFAYLAAAVIPCALSAQQVAAIPSGGTAAPPTAVLYRMLFRHIVATEDAAGELDTQKKSGGDELRGRFQKELHLSNADATKLKSQASACTKQLSDQDARAIKVVAAARTQDASATPGQAPVASASTKGQLDVLEQERSDMTQACIQALQSALGTRTFGDLEVYVKTTMAGRTVVIRPPMTKPTAPLPDPGAVTGGK